MYIGFLQGVILISIQKLRCTLSNEKHLPGTVEVLYPAFKFVVIIDAIHNNIVHLRACSKSSFDFYIEN